MKIVVGRPPNFDAIAAALPGAHAPGVIFCYGDTIYNPGGGRISSVLRAHEAVHSRRQGSSIDEIEAWWARYIRDPQFRAAEELVAHQVEFATFCAQERDKERRHRFLVGLAQRLSGPVYGGVLDYTAAKHAIRAGALR